MIINFHILFPSLFNENWWEWTNNENPPLAKIWRNLSMVDFPYLLIYFIPPKNIIPKLLPLYFWALFSFLSYYYKWQPYILRLQNEFILSFIYWPFNLYEISLLLKGQSIYIYFLLFAFIIHYHISSIIIKAIDYNLYILAHHYYYSLLLSIGAPGIILLWLSFIYWVLIKWKPNIYYSLFFIMNFHEE